MDTRVHVWWDQSTCETWVQKSDAQLYTLSRINMGVHITDPTIHAHINMSAHLLDSLLLLALCVVHVVPKNMLTLHWVRVG